jgi:hypothetical protein
MDAATRFWDKVDRGPVPEYDPTLGNCWLWTAATDPRGYGRFDQRPFGTALAHRVSLILDGQILEPGLTVDHLCRVRSCVRPSHLEQVTTQVNTGRTPTEILSARQPRKTHCTRGHPYDSANTRTDPRGHRHCRTCDRENASRRSESRRAARIEKYGYDPGPRARFTP